MRVAALLRGINIGPHKRIAMPALRSIVESLGHTDVETYLQSGNVVFTQRGRADPGPALAAAIAAATGLDVEVVTRTGAELARVVEANPYPVVDPTKVVVGFLADAVELADLELGDLSGYLPDELTVVGPRGVRQRAERPGAVEADGGAHQAPADDDPDGAELGGDRLASSRSHGWLSHSSPAPACTKSDTSGVSRASDW